jgi:acetyl-CoA carboxylase biotin carboxyl carrier protein
MAKTPFDSEMIRALASLLDETHLSEIEYEAQGVRVRIARQISVAAPAALAMPAAAMAAPVAAEAPPTNDPASHPGALKSPMVGVVYLAQEPGATPFVAVGDSIAEGQTVLLIEAMKTYNPIRAPKAGKLAAMLVEDGQPVEFGELLAIIG